MKKYVRSNSQHENPMAQEVVNLLNKTDEIIDDFKANREFDPFSALTDNEDMGQQLYGASVTFQADIKEAIDKFRKSTTWSARLF